MVVSDNAPLLVRGLLPLAPKSSRQTCGFAAPGFSASPTSGFAVEKTYPQKYTTHLPDTQGIVTHGVNAFVKSCLIVLAQDSHVLRVWKSDCFPRVWNFPRFVFPLSGGVC
jgi:hypothetical protein